MLSLALNLCTAAGFAYSRWGIAPEPGATPEKRLEMLAERLKLKPEQMQSFVEFKRGLRFEQADLAQQNLPVMKDAWDELRKPNPDPQRVQLTLDQMAMHRHAFEVDASALLIRFMSNLTQNQREILADAVLDRKDPAGAIIRNNVN